MIPDQVVGVSGGDDRDWYPFEQAALLDEMLFPHDEYYILGPFTPAQFDELVWRVRNVQVQYNYTSPSGSFAGTYDVANNSGNGGTLPPTREEDILAFQDNYGSIFDFDGINPVIVDNTYVGASWAHYTFEAGEFYCFFRVTCGTASSFGASTGLIGSALTCNFLGIGIPMFEGVGNPTTGSIDIVPHPSAIAYWGWDGRFDPTTGAAL